jgi:hypothetical protein
MQAEIIFIETDDINPVVEKLLELDYDLEILNWDFGDGDATSTITATAITELGEFAFFDHVQTIVGPLGGDVIEAGLMSSPPPGFA